MIDITVTDAQLVNDPSGRAVWALATEVTRDGQTQRRLHIIPEDTFEWRAAEYGIDDPDELLEVVLYEPYLDREDPLEHPDSVVNAPSRQRARDHHLARVRAARGAGKLRDRNPRAGETRPAGAAARVFVDNRDVSETPLEMLRREIVIDPERVAVMREHVEHTRSQVAARRQARQAAARTMAVGRRRESAEQLRARLSKARQRPI